MNVCTKPSASVQTVLSCIEVANFRWSLIWRHQMWQFWATMVTVCMVCSCEACLRWLLVVKWTFRSWATAPVNILEVTITNCTLTLGIMLYKRTSHLRVAFDCDHTKACMCNNHGPQSASWNFIHAKRRTIQGRLKKMVFVEGHTPTSHSTLLADLIARTLEKLKEILGTKHNVWKDRTVIYGIIVIRAQTQSMQGPNWNWRNY